MASNKMVGLVYVLEYGKSVKSSMKVSKKWWRMVKRGKNNIVDVSSIRNGDMSTYWAQKIVLKNR